MTPEQATAHNEAIRAKIAARVKGQQTPKLQEMARLLMENDEPGSDAVFQAVLLELEGRMPEPDYSEFARSL